MDEAERLVFRAMSDLPSFKRLLERTRRIITNALSGIRQPYVAVSGGKDSIVLLHLVHRLNPSMPAIFSDDEWQYPETLDYLNTVSGLTRIASTVKHAEWFTSWPDGPVDLPQDTIWVDAKQGDGISRYARSQGYDGCFLGLRKEEAAYRSIHLSRHGSFFFCKDHQMYECNPLAHWKVEDIWTYIFGFDIPYNHAYDVLSRLNVPLKYQRVGPLAVEKVLGYGQLTILKKGWPDLFNRFAARYPEANLYV